MPTTRQSNLIRTVCLKVNGSQCDKDEKFKAAQYVRQLKVSQFISTFLYVINIIILTAVISRETESG